MQYESVKKKKFSRRLMVCWAIVLLLIPMTILFGEFFLKDRKYFIISILVIIYMTIPFIMAFEERKPQARELVIIGVMSAIAVVGRAIFIMLPQFKPAVAVIIITAVCFGAEAGFLTGAVTGFVSNFFFGQGPWTPWQMFSFGIIGFLAGILFKRGALSKRLVPLCIFGFLATFVIYGGIMDFASLTMFTTKITKEALITTYLAGIPFNAVHAVSTFLFLLAASQPLIEILDRIKMKYGLLEQ